MGRRIRRSAAPGSSWSAGTGCSKGRASRCHLQAVMRALAAAHERRLGPSAYDADHSCSIADIVAMVAMTGAREAIVDMASLACMAIKIDLLSAEPGHLQLPRILPPPIQGR